MEKMLKIRGKSYSVVKCAGDPNGKTPLTCECPHYELSGVRGSQYYTMRNVHKPHLMFLVNARNFTSKVMDRVWLSDEKGYLEVVSE